VVLGLKLVLVKLKLLALGKQQGFLVVIVVVKLGQLMAFVVASHLKITMV
jgi:hypothetical protein